MKTLIIISKNKIMLTYFHPNIKYKIDNIILFYFKLHQLFYWVRYIRNKLHLKMKLMVNE